MPIYVKSSIDLGTITTTMEISCMIILDIMQMLLPTIYSKLFHYVSDDHVHDDLNLELFD